MPYIRGLPCNSSPPPPITLPSAGAGSSLCAKLRLRRPHAAADQGDHWRGPCSGCCSCLPCGDHSIWINLRLSSNPKLVYADLHKRKWKLCGYSPVAAPLWLDCGCGYLATTISIIIEIWRLSEASYFNSQTTEFCSYISVFLFATKVWPMSRSVKYKKFHCQILHIFKRTLYNTAYALFLSADAVWPVDSISRIPKVSLQGAANPSTSTLQHC